MKNLLKLGKTLNKIEQKQINGGANSCPPGTCRNYTGHKGSGGWGACRPCGEETPPNQ
ncbi:hypothetical protein [Tenacibaculum halocynthiae]|uniref:hypothetical protein n=1 Tax=Tenacibaculum halocynthiae TaxID=1254437 RepID=UPI0026078981|nr:hypothetical protein [uncultured Tenacibaculum sp.]